MARVRLVEQAVVAPPHDPIEDRNLLVVPRLWAQGGSDLDQPYLSQVRGYLLQSLRETFKGEVIPMYHA